MATVDDVSSDEIAVANVYDEIVFARTLVTFDDVREFLKKERNHLNYYGEYRI